MFVTITIKVFFNKNKNQLVTRFETFIKSALDNLLWIRIHNGTMEIIIIITGMHINSYGYDNDPAKSGV